jgi:hypothetical protein
MLTTKFRSNLIPGLAPKTQVAISPELIAGSSPILYHRYLIVYGHVMTLYIIFIDSGRYYNYMYSPSRSRATSRSRAFPQSRLPAVAPSRSRAFPQSEVHKCIRQFD